MKIYNYIAVLHPRPNGGYGIMFPDFPGCVSIGNNFENALWNGTKALSAHTELMDADGEKIRKPRSLEMIRSKENWIEWEDAIISIVPLLAHPEKSVCVQITLPLRLLTRIDAISKNRSAFLANAAEKSLKKLLKKREA